jgi:hypothetical protein
MRTLLVSAVLALTLSSTANARPVAKIYKCPEVHPEKNSGPRLTNATMYLGELHGQGVLHGDVAQVKDGSDIHYDFPEGVPRWLVCSYGGQRIAGTAIDPPRVVGATDWWMPVDSLVDDCNLKIREAKGEDTWAAAATCKTREPPYPYMVQ